MSTPKHFGTDGLRDVANRGLLTPERVLALGRALGRMARETGDPVVLARDPRRSSPLLAAALSAGIASEGVAVVDLGVLPTPGLASLLPRLGASYGAMISASHNPMQDNGIKILRGDGSKLAEREELALEAGLFAPAPEDGPVGADVGAIAARDDAVALYEQVLAERFPRLRLDGMRIVVDAAHGATFEIAPRVLRDLGAEVILLNAEPDGLNINAGCGAVHPEGMARAVKRHGARVGVAFDGDGDRAILASADGQVRDGDSVLYACGLDLHRRGLLAGGVVVGTVMSNFGLELALRDAGLRLERTPVGDRHVAQSLRQNGFALGGEPSGHVIFGATHGYVGDGLYTALVVFELMARTGQGLDQLAAGLVPLPQVLINVRVRAKKPLGELDAVRRRIEAGEARLASNGRLLVRYSGTENLLRVMTEGTDAAVVDEVAKDIAAAVQAEIGEGARSSP